PVLVSAFSSAFVFAPRVEFEWSFIWALPGALGSPGFIAGAIFSAGAFCCAAGARSGAGPLSLGRFCAVAAPAAITSAAAAAVVRSFFFIVLSSGYPAETHTFPSNTNVCGGGGVPKVTGLLAFARHCLPGSPKAPSLERGGGLGETHVHHRYGRNRIPRQCRGPARARRRMGGAAGRRGAGRTAESARAPRRPRQAAAARPRDEPDRSGLAVSGAVAACRRRHVWRRHPRRRTDHRHRPRRRPRMHGG